MILAIAALLLLADQDATTTTSTAPPAPTSSLVAAAHKAKATRATTTRKVITNADVKKSKAKLIELPLRPLPNAAKDDRSTMEKYQAERKAAAASELKQQSAQQRVARLEKELAEIEQSYYAENDPAYRDDVIRPKFEAKRKELESARVELQQVRPQ